MRGASNQEWAVINAYSISELKSESESDGMVLIFILRIKRLSELNLGDSFETNPVLTMKELEFGKTKTTLLYKTFNFVT